MHQEDEMSYNGVPSPPCFFPQGFLLPPLDIGGAMQGRRPPWGDDAGDEDLSDDCSLPGEKKRRLSVEQVRTLERSFEAANKLEPERKTNLARALGLQPRQVAIWFQNRRARWKTKQLEKDFDSLKRDFDLLKSHNDSLLAHNKTLHTQLMALRGREGAELINLNKETEGSSSNRSDNSCDVNLDEPLDPNQCSKDFFPPFRNPPKMMMDTDDENFGNVFYGGSGGSGGSGGGVDEPSAFWPWAEH